MKKIHHVLFLAMMFLFVACSDEFKTVESYEYEGKFPDESAKNIELVFSDSGRISFIIAAPVLNKYISDNSYMDCPEGVTITSFDEYGNEQSVLTADYAISIDQTEQMEAHRNVVIRDVQKNETIETEQIVWDKRNRRIYSDVEVKQTNADGTVNYGEGFESDDRFSRYVIRKSRFEILADDL